MRETHEKLKVGTIEVLNCYYAHCEEDTNFQRRCYWMARCFLPLFLCGSLVRFRSSLPSSLLSPTQLNSEEAIVLVHYLYTQSHLAPREAEVVGAAESPNRVPPSLFFPAKQKAHSNEEQHDRGEGSSAQAQTHHQRGDPLFRHAAHRGQAKLEGTPEGYNAHNLHQQQQSAEMAWNIRDEPPLPHLREPPVLEGLQEDPLGFELEACREAASLHSEAKPESNQTHNPQGIERDERRRHGTSAKELESELIEAEEQLFELGKQQANYPSRQVSSQWGRELEERLTSLEHGAEQLLQRRHGGSAQDPYSASVDGSSGGSSRSNGHQQQQQQQHPNAFVASGKRPANKRLTSEEDDSGVDTDVRSVQPGTNEGAVVRRTARQHSHKQQRYQLPGAGDSLLDPVDDDLANPFGPPPQPFGDSDSGGTDILKARTGNNSPHFNAMPNFGPSRQTEEVPSFDIIDFCPEWDMEVGGAKVFVTGRLQFGGSQGSQGRRLPKCCVMFGDVQVEAEWVVQGVLRCRAPMHTPGVVPLCVTVNSAPISTAHEFEYRAAASRDQLSHSQRANDLASSSDREFTLGLVQMLLDSASGSDEGNANANFRADEADNNSNNTSNSNKNNHYSSNCNSTSSTSVQKKVAKLESQSDDMLLAVLRNLIERRLRSLAYSNGAKRTLGKPDAKGLNALHNAAAAGAAWAIRILSSSGAVSLDAPDAHGHTALHWAAARGKEQAAAALLSAGASASPLVGIRRPCTPADLASANGHLGIAAYIAETALSKSLMAVHGSFNKGEAGSGAGLPSGKGRRSRRRGSSHHTNHVSNGCTAVEKDHRDQAADIAEAAERKAQQIEAAFGGGKRRHRPGYARAQQAMMEEKAAWEAHRAERERAASSIQDSFATQHDRERFLVLRGRISQLRSFLQTYQQRNELRKVREAAVPSAMPMPSKGWVPGDGDGGFAQPKKERPAGSGSKNPNKHGKREDRKRTHRREMGYGGVGSDSPTDKADVGPEDEIDEEEEGENNAVHRAVSCIQQLVRSREAREQYLRIRHQATVC